MSALLALVGHITEDVHRHEKRRGLRLRNRLVEVQTKILQMDLSDRLRREQLDRAARMEGRRAWRRGVLAEIRALGVTQWVEHPYAVWELQLPDGASVKRMMPIELLEPADVRAALSSREGVARRYSVDGGGS